MIWAWLLLSGCKAPPEAPEEVDALAAFSFSRQLDEDPADLALGLENLRAWFEVDFDEKEPGFELVQGLAQADVDALNVSATFQSPDAKAERSVAALAGAAAGSVGVHAVGSYAFALTAVDQDVVFPKTFAEWGREWHLCDGVQFADRDCEAAESEEAQTSTFALGLRSEGVAYNQYRWVDLSDGSAALMHRNWQIFPPEVNNRLLEVEDQYYLNLFLPSEDGERVFRFQATWAVFGDGVPRDTGLNLTTKSMTDSSEELEQWLDDQGAK